jgi:CRP-like cAMP-binding protein
MEEIIQNLNIDIESNTVFFKKGHVLQKQGSQNLNGYLVRKGLVKSYTVDEKGKKHIFMFAPENWVISDIESLEFDQPTELFIECVEDSELLVLNRRQINQIDVSLEHLQLMNKRLFRRIAVLQKRIIMLMSSSAQERYQKFLEDYPDLPNRIPQWMIASYLGITPEALSKIRGQMARNK